MILKSIFEHVLKHLSYNVWDWSLDQWIRSIHLDETYSIIESSRGSVRNFFDINDNILMKI